MRYIDTTAEAVSKLRSQARKIARAGKSSHTEALDLLARRHGYGSWKHVTRCLAASASNVDQSVHSPARLMVVRGKEAGNSPYAYGAAYDVLSRGGEVLIVDRCWDYGRFVLSLSGKVFVHSRDHGWGLRADGDAAISMADLATVDDSGRVPMSEIMDLSEKVNDVKRSLLVINDLRLSSRFVDGLESEVSRRLTLGQDVLLTRMDPVECEVLLSKRMPENVVVSMYSPA